MFTILLLHVPNNWCNVIALKVSLTDSDGTQNNHYDEDARIHRPLRLKKKFYEFYTAPITKFWADSVSLRRILIGLINFH